ncbi:hypothetical protein HDU91_006080, partial [Kappamyces sp. JEL0680]
DSTLETVIVVQSHLSSLAPGILKLVHDIAGWIKTAQLSKAHVKILTTLGENAHIEMLEFHDEWEGVWSDSRYASPKPSPASPSSLGYFDAVSKKLLAILTQAAGLDASCSAEVARLPSCVWTTKDVFCIDGFADLFPPLLPEHAASSAAPTAVDGTCRELAARISSFLDDAAIKESVFAIGTLDLVGPSFHSDNVLDLVYDAHPRSRPHSWECLLDTDKYLLDGAGSAGPDSQIPLYHQSDSLLLDLFHLLLTLETPREAMNAIKWARQGTHSRSRMVEFIQHNVSPLPPDLGRFSSAHTTPDDLQELAGYLKNQPGLLFRFEARMSCFAAFASAFSSNIAVRQELLSAEKVIVALLSQTQESSHVFYQLHDLLLKITKEKQQGSGSTTLTTRDVLLLTLHMYALMGDSLEIEVQHELYLQKAFVQAMLASNPKVNPRAVSSWVGRVFQQLSQVSRLRSQLRDPNLRRLMEYDAGDTYVPFLVKLSTHCVLQQTHPSAPSDLHYIPYKGAISTVLKGFSRLIGTEPNHPASHSTVILFVIGGITYREVSLLQALYRERAVKLLVGSTTICNRDTMMAHIFKSK